MNESIGKVFFNVFMEKLKLMRKKIVEETKKRVFPGSNSIVWSSSQYEGKEFALDCEKTVLRFLYTLGIIRSSKDLFNVLSCTCITQKYVQIWQRELRSNGLFIVLVIVKLESPYWIVIGSKFRMRLWLYSQGSSRISGTSISVEIKEACALSRALNESVICMHSWKSQ